MSRETGDWLWVEGAEPETESCRRSRCLFSSFCCFLLPVVFFEAGDAAKETESSSTRLHPPSTYTAAAGSFNETHCLTH